MFLMTPIPGAIDSDYLMLVMKTGFFRSLFSVRLELTGDEPGARLRSMWNQARAAQIPCPETPEVQQRLVKRIRTMLLHVEESQRAANQTHSILHTLANRREIARQPGMLEHLQEAQRLNRANLSLTLLLTQALLSRAISGRM
jgi:hypothetical protein